MDNHTVKGKVHEIAQIQKGKSQTGKEWKRQNLVIDTGDDYNPHLSISFLGAKTELLEGLQIGQEVIVFINLSSKEWQGKWFTNVNGWKIDNVFSDEPTNDFDDAPF